MDDGAPLLAEDDYCALTVASVIIPVLLLYTCLLFYVNTVVD